MPCDHPSDRALDNRSLSPFRWLASVLIATAGLLPWTLRADAQQPWLEQPAKVKQPSVHHLSAADEKAIRGFLKDQETAWNKHDMAAFTRPLRDDGEGINVAGMYWGGKPAIVKHLAELH